MGSSTKKPGKSRKKPILSVGTFVTIVATLLLRVFVVQGYSNPTGSMENTILPGETMLVNKFIYGAESPTYLPFTDIKIPHFRLPALRLPHRGDIVVFDWPGMRDQVRPTEQTNYLKRCVGLPGDTIRIIDRILYVNGSILPIPPKEKLETPYILPGGYENPDIFPEGSGFNEDNYGPIVIPKQGDRIELTAQNFLKWRIFIEREGHSCRLADDRIIIDGVQSSQYVVEQNYYFMMGDNRENSLDSRFWGFVPYSSIEGQPILVYWSWDPDISYGDIFAKIASLRWYRIGIVLK